jgi:hypothetical protein
VRVWLQETECRAVVKLLYIARVKLYLPTQCLLVTTTLYALTRRKATSEISLHCFCRSCESVCWALSAKFGYRWHGGLKWTMWSYVLDNERWLRAFRTRLLPDLEGIPSGYSKLTSRERVHYFLTYKVSVNNNCPWLVRLLSTIVHPYEELKSVALEIKYYSSRKRKYRIDSDDGEKLEVYLRTWSSAL